MGRNTITILILLVFCGSTFAAESRIKSWWGSTSKKRYDIQAEAQTAITDPEQAKCEMDLRHWNEKLLLQPNSLYYQYKREETTKRCLPFSGLQ